MGRHVLILNERDLDHPRAGGAEIHLFETFGRLAAAGDRVTLLAAGLQVPEGRRGRERWSTRGGPCP